MESTKEILIRTCQGLLNQWRARLSDSFLEKALLEENIRKLEKVLKELEAE